MTVLRREATHMRGWRTERNLSIRDWARMEDTIRRRMRTRFRRERSLLMPWWVIRIAEKLHFSTSLPVLTSMLATSRVSPSTGRMALLKGIPTLTLRIYPEYIRCRHTAVRRLYRVTLCSMNTQRQLST